MKKDLKKSNFLQGAFIATFGIVFSKILGMIYVIPFYSLIGDKGGALYGYAYNIYSIFLSISTAGIPLAISSMTSEYNTLGYLNTKERIFRIARKYLSIVGIACFIVLFIFSEQIAYLILGDVTGGNTIDDVTFVIRVISFSILIVPTLSVYRGYLQGHKYIAPTSVSQVLEQLIRVSIIIVGSYVAVNVLNLPIKFAVSTALFGATIGSLFSLIYLIYIRNKNKDKINISAEITKEEKKITDRQIIKQIMICAFPFIFCDVCKSLYNSVDTFFVVKTLVKFGYTTNVAETVMGVISTWGNKLNMIIIAIGSGFAVSLIPNLAESLAKNDKEEAERKIGTAFKTLALLILPMTLGLSFLSVPVWNIFYGASEYGPIVFRFSIVVAIATVMLSCTQIIALAFKEYKILFAAVLFGLIFNACFDIPLMYLCELFGAGYYGATLSTCLGHLITVSIVITLISKKHNLKFNGVAKSILLSILFTVLMLGLLYFVSFIIPLNVTNRFASVLVVIVYALIGGLFYLFMSSRFGIVQDIFGNDWLNKLKLKFLKKIR